MNGQLPGGGATVFHAGTKLEDGGLVTAGGRVLRDGRGRNAAGGGEGRLRRKRTFILRGMHMRSDIGARALAAGRKGTEPWQYSVFMWKKRPEHAVEAKGLLAEFRGLLGAKGPDGLRILNRYDVEGMAPEQFRQAVPVVFPSPQLDDVHTAIPEGSFTVFATEYLPGQFDQRAASAARVRGPSVWRRAPGRGHGTRVPAFGQRQRGRACGHQKYVINPVEAREASLEEKEDAGGGIPGAGPCRHTDGLH